MSLLRAVIIILHLIIVIVMIAPLFLSAASNRMALKLIAVFDLLVIAQWFSWGECILNTIERNLGGVTTDEVPYLREISTWAPVVSFLYIAKKLATTHRDRDDDRGDLGGQQGFC